jgi:hypothetical protein
MEKMRDDDIMFASRQEALDEWKRISFSIYNSDPWRYPWGASEQRDRIREKYNLTLPELQSGKAVY